MASYDPTPPCTVMLYVYQNLYTYMYIGWYLCACAFMSIHTPADATVGYPRSLYVCRYLNMYMYSCVYLCVCVSVCEHLCSRVISISYIYREAWCVCVVVCVWVYAHIFAPPDICGRSMRGGGLGSRPKKMYGERLGDGVEYHLMSPTPRR